MAYMTDIRTVIASALGEISVTGTLDVTMDGAETVEALGRPTGDDFEKLVVVRHVSDQTNAGRQPDR